MIIFHLVCIGDAKSLHTSAQISKKRQQPSKRPIFGTFPCVARGICYINAIGPLYSCSYYVCKGCQICHLLSLKWSRKWLKCLKMANVSWGSASFCVQHAANMHPQCNVSHPMQIVGRTVRLFHLVCIGDATSLHSSAQLVKNGPKPWVTVFLCLFPGLHVVYVNLS